MNVSHQRKGVTQQVYRMSHISFVKDEEASEGRRTVWRTALRVCHWNSTNKFIHHSRSVTRGWTL